MLARTILSQKECLQAVETLQRIVESESSRPRLENDGIEDVVHFEEKVLELLSSFNRRLEAALAHDWVTSG